MKRRTTALLLSCFFVSSVIGVTAVKQDSDFDGFSFYDQISEDLQTPDSYVEQAELAKAEQEPYLSESTTTDSDVILVESKEDRRRLQQQQRELDRQKQTALTARLNAQVKAALAAQLNKDGVPAKMQIADNKNVAQANALAQPALAQSPNATEKNSTQIAALNSEQAINQLRKALNLSPPILIGTFGGGNGNGGPGAATTISASAN